MLASLPILSANTTTVSANPRTLVLILALPEHCCYFCCWLLPPNAADSGLAFHTGVWHRLHLQRPKQDDANPPQSGDVLLCWQPDRRSICSGMPIL